VCFIGNRKSEKSYRRNTFSFGAQWLCCMEYDDGWMDACMFVSHIIYIYIYYI